MIKDLSKYKQLTPTDLATITGGRSELGKWWKRVKDFGNVFLEGI